MDFQVDDYLERWVAMWNSYDLSEVDQLFVTDSRVTYLSSEKEGVIVGFDAVREHHAGFGFVEGGKEQGNKLWVDGVRTSVFEASAVVGGIWYFQRTGESEKVQRGPFTLVYVKIGDEIRIAHAHFANYPDGENE